MLKRLLVPAVGTVVLLAASTAQADDDLWKDRDNPGVGVIITTPDKPAGGGGTFGAESSGGNTSEAPVRNPWIDEICRSTSADAGGAIQDVDCAVEDAGEPEDDGPVDAAAVARTLLDRLDIPRPQMNTSPQAPVKALVGLETWLWVEPAQWTPLELSASLGGTTVTVTARPIQSRWDMGEGTKACGGPGRVWRKGLGQKATTPCGYTYKRTSVREPNDKYDVSAVMRYAITWTCTGDCSAGSGDLGTLDSLADTAQLEVGERQSVVIR